MLKNKIKILSLTIIAFFIFILLDINNVDAASANISTKTSVNKGESVTVTANVSAGAWNLTLSGAGQSVKLVGQTSTTANASDSKSITFTANQNTTFTLTGDITDFDTDVTTNVSKSAVINVSQTTSSTSTTSNNSETTNQETNKKSSNANLSNLGIRPNDFTGFKAATTSYNVIVPSDVQEIEVYAIAQDSKAKISGTGKKQLQEGQNTIAVVVTAEDGTKKTYTINVTKSGETEEPEKEEEVSKGLSELKIGDLGLTPEFKTDVYEYTIKYVGTETSLDINAIATDKDYIVDIIGNENLQEGENIISILVSDAEENNVATYKIKVNKSLTEEVAIQAENQNVKDGQKQNKIIIIGVIILVGIITIIIYIIIRRKRNENWEEDYSMPYSDEKEYENQDNSIEEHQSNKSEEYDEQNNNVEEYNNEDDNNEKYNNQNDKEILKEKFLNNYNSNNNEYEDWKEDKPKRKRHKGKRFK